MEIKQGDCVFIKAKIARLPHEKDNRYVYVVDEHLGLNCRYGECTKDSIQYLLGMDLSNAQ